MHAKRADIAVTCKMSRTPAMCYITSMSRSEPRPTRFALVADDFAFTEGISLAILDLLAMERLSGTGVMTNRPHWPAFAPALRAAAGPADVGLHLNLTVGAPLGRSPVKGGGGELPRFSDLARAAVSGGIDETALADEVARQVEAFARCYGRLPAFIDGHQHVHVVPSVRTVVLEIVARTWPDGERPWLRDPFDTPGHILVRGAAVAKSLVIAILSMGWRRQAGEAGCATNRGFSGVSAFDPRGDFAGEFARFLRAPGPAHLVMCHPGHVDAELARLDPVVATRPLEFLFLAGTGMPAALEEAGLALAPMSEILAAADPALPPPGTPATDRPGDRA